MEKVLVGDSQDPSETFQGPKGNTLRWFQCGFRRASVPPGGGQTIDTLARYPGPYSDASAGRIRREQKQ